MMGNKIKFLFLCATLLITTVALSADRVLELNFYGEKFKNESIGIKNAIKRQYRNLKIKNFNLDKVVVVAKTKNGNGRASLVVNGYRSSGAVVDGYPREFRRPGNFDRVTLHNYSYGSRGAWKVRLDGVFKVKKLKVHLERKYRRNPRNPRRPTEPRRPRQPRRPRW